MIVGRTVIGYMCQIAAEHELCEDAGGTKVYGSVDELKEAHTCWESCGIVRVKVEIVAVEVAAQEDDGA